MSALANKVIKILLVEDEPIVMLVHRRLLTDLGYTPDTAVNGKEALEKSTAQYDLIFMDVDLPDMSGIDVTKEIRKNESKDKKSKIIALTGYSQADIHEQCRSSGMDDVILKPVDQNKLKEILEKS